MSGAIANIGDNCDFQNTARFGVVFARKVADATTIVAVPPLVIFQMNDSVGHAPGKMPIQPLETSGVAPNARPVSEAGRSEKISLNTAAKIAQSSRDAQKSLLQKRLEMGAEKSAQEVIDTIGVKQALKDIKADRRPNPSVTPDQTRYAIESLLNQATSALAAAVNATAFTEHFERSPVAVTLANECQRAISILRPAALSRT